MDWAVAHTPAASSERGPVSASLRQQQRCQPAIARADAASCRQVGWLGPREKHIGAPPLPDEEWQDRIERKVRRTVHSGAKPNVTASHQAKTRPLVALEADRPC